MLKDTRDYRQNKKRSYKKGTRDLWNTRRKINTKTILKEWTTPDSRNTSSTTNLEEEEIVDALGNDGNASLPEQVTRPNSWRKMMMVTYIHMCYVFRVWHNTLFSFVALTYLSMWLRHNVMARRFWCFEKCHINEFHCVKDKMKECKQTGSWCIKKEWNRSQVSLGYFTLKMHPRNSESSVTLLSDSTGHHPERHESSAVPLW